MRFDWTINITALLALVGAIVTLVGAYYGLQAKFSALTQGIDAKFAQIVLQLNTLIEGDIRELRGRILKQETTQTEWIQMLRDRDHELGAKLNVALLEIDRLKRPNALSTATEAMALKAPGNV